jgi:glycosyltransferase involved in cell wall biosynthesis
VHIHTASGSSFWALSIAAFMCRVLRRCPIIFHIHGGGFGRFIDRCSGLKGRWLRASLRRAAAVVVLSGYWQEVLSKIVPAERVHVIENAALFPETEPRPVGQAPYTILFVGFLEKHKGIYELLEAAAQLGRSHEGRFFFRIAGDEEVVGHRDQVAARHRELELGNVELLGPVRGEALLALYREADIFVLPSHTEALPMVVLEAMASSLPLVVTPVGSLPEVLGAENALFVPPGDAAALAEAIVALADDPEGRLKMAAENLRLFRDRFRVDRFARDVEAVYVDVLGRRG